MRNLKGKLSHGDRVYGASIYRSLPSKLLFLMEVSGQLHAATTLPPGRQPNIKKRPYNLTGYAFFRRAFYKLREKQFNNSFYAINGMFHSETC
jgi:hypothetical protein